MVFCVTTFPLTVYNGYNSYYLRKKFEIEATMHQKQAEQYKQQAQEEKETRERQVAQLEERLEVLEEEFYSHGDNFGSDIDL